MKHATQFAVQIRRKSSLPLPTHSRTQTQSSSHSNHVQLFMKVQRWAWFPNCRGINNWRSISWLNIHEYQNLSLWHPRYRSDWQDEITSMNSLLTSTHTKYHVPHAHCKGQQFKSEKHTSRHSTLTFTTIRFSEFRRKLSIDFARTNGPLKCMSIRRGSSFMIENVFASLDTSGECTRHGGGVKALQVLITLKKVQSQKFSVMKLSTNIFHSLEIKRKTRGNEQ